MKIGFLLDRVGQYKVFASVIDHALKEGVDVVVLYSNDPEGKLGSKAYQWSSPGYMPDFRYGRPRQEIWQSWDGLGRLCEQESFNFVVSQWVKGKYRPLSQRLRPQGTKWISLQHSYEHLAIPFANFSNADLTCLYSDYWIDRTFEVLAPQIDGQKPDGESAAQYFNRITAATGFPELDQLEMIDREAVRRRLRIPEGQPVVLYITYGLLWQADNQWEDLVLAQPTRRAALRRVIQKGKLNLLKYAWQGMNYDALLRGIRAFCDRNDAFLISKSRIKDQPPLLEMQLADYHTYDAGTYPHTILEMLAISDLVLHPISTVGLEAGFTGTPAVALMPPLDVSQAGAFPHKYIFEKLQYDEADSIFNFDGVSYPVDMIEAVRVLPDANLSDFPLVKERREAYVKKYLGFDDYQSAARVWRRIKDLYG